MVSVWFEGVEELMQVQADLGAAGDRVGRQAAALVRRTAAAIEATAKQLAPVDTGALRGSIGTDIAGDGRSTAMEATIGPTAAYGVFQEFGTSRMAPHPFMIPALDRHGPGFAAAVEALADPLP